ncbi:hypothetical protein NBRC110019_23410 [Neptunitalea chrysea]|uniref:Uncharacterized protein n=1 Tax=Neptunitalea chrysea TaxID=1647581 RepID=A0A9W6EUB9_9FLAO|nr:hypothetical protein [Neptunitalea chrysea]GLB53300.1 hypothetical protein NBRC110019_23410 [Neptunitalea chrysea]
MEISKTILGYIIYLPIVLFLTLYVGKTLFKNSIIYMNDIFKNREELAAATNTLFKIGFYLLNIGFALLILKLSLHENSTQQLIEALSFKIGKYTIYLGIMLFIHLFLFFRGKKKSKKAISESYDH